jgi:hypothetical protein
VQLKPFFKIACISPLLAGGIDIRTFMREIKTCHEERLQPEGVFYLTQNIMIGW